jgi:hypothetical protein
MPEDPKLACRSVSLGAAARAGVANGATSPAAAKVFKAARRVT